MSRRFSTLLFLFFPVLLFSDIHGVVSDPSGSPVSGATVYLLGGPARITTTDSTGAYNFKVNSPGRYTLVAGAPGLAGRPADLDYRATDVKVNLTLNIAARSETVVVTAERADLPMANVASSTTVLTRSELDEMHVENVAEALRLVPGLAVNQTGSRGNVASLFARGANSNMNLVMVDGVRINDFGGGFNFTNLPIENVERIEIVRGPQSALYGSNAIGAVVQIITRHAAPAADGSYAPEVRAEAEGGSFGYARGHIGSAIHLGRMALNVDLSHLSSDGLVPNDDYRNETASLSTSYDVGASARLSYSFTAGANESGAAGPYGSNPAGIFTGINRISRSKENSYRHGFRYEMQAGRVRQRFDGGIFDEDFIFRSKFGESRTSNFRSAVESQTEISLAAGDVLVLGVEYQRERVGNSFLADTGGRLFPVRRDSFGYFVENRFELGGRFFLTTGLRLEDVRTDGIPSVQFGPAAPRGSNNVLAVNPKLTAAFLPRPNSLTKFHGSVGTGLRAPDGFELAFTDNPALKPERTTSFDLGVEQSIWKRRAVFDLTYFRNRFHDLIVTLGPSFKGLSQWQSDNVANSRAQGLEFSYALRLLSSLRVSGHYTWSPTEVLSLDGAPGRAQTYFKAGQQLIRRPEHSAAYEIVWRHGRYTADTAAFFRSSVLDIEPSFGASGGLFRNAGYVRPDVGLEVAVTRDVAIYGRLRNFTDARYEETYGFPSLRRNFIAGMKFRFGAR